MENEILVNLETGEQFILNLIGPCLWSITNEEDRVESISTLELLTKYFKTGVIL